MFPADGYITNSGGQLVLSVTDVISDTADGSKLATDKAVKEAVASVNNDVVSGLSGKADLNAGNLSDENIADWRTKLGGGTVDASSNGFVTGAVLYGEVRLEAGSYSYIDQHESTGSNLVRLDRGIKGVDERVTAVDTRVTAVDNAWKSADGLDQNAWLGRLSGTISANGADNASLNGSGFVTGTQIYNYVTPTGLSSGTYLTGNTVGENLKALDGALQSVSQSIPTNAANSSLSNLTADGESVIQELAKDAVSIGSASGSLITVTQDSDSKAWTIGGITAGTVAQNDTGIVTGNDVWNALQDKVNSSDLNETVTDKINEYVANNDQLQNAIDEAVSNQDAVKTAISNALTDIEGETLTSFSEKVAAGGTVAEQDEKAVSGKTVFEYLHGANIAFGQNAEVTGNNSIAIGTGNVVGGNNSGAFGDPSIVNANNAYSLGNNNRIEAGADGSFAIGNENKIQAGGENTFVIGSNVTTSAKNAVVLGAGSTGVDNAVSVGSAGAERRIVNVAPGNVAPGSTDAVNGDQLYSTQQAIIQTNQSVNQVANKLHKEINRAAANSAAMAALHPLDMDEDHHWSAAAGVGNYSGEQALAVGVFFKPTPNFMVSMGASSTTNGDTMVNAGLSYRFGAPSTYGTTTQSELTQKVVMLTNQNLTLEAQLESARLREQSMADRVKKSREELDALKAEIELMKEVLGIQKKVKAKTTK